MNSFESYLKFYNHKYGYSYNEDDGDYYYKFIIKNMNKYCNLNIIKKIIMKII